MEDWIGFSSIGTSIYPVGTLICFTVAWFFNKRYYYQEISRTGYVEKLFSVENDLKNFKEVIRKEVCEQIVKGMSIIFNEQDYFQPPSDQSSDNSSDSHKKTNYSKVKDSVINLVRKTRERLTTAEVGNRSLRKRVDLVDNMKIRRESRAKRTFYLSDDDSA